MSHDALPDLWYVVQTEPKREALVMLQLPRGDFEVYRPVVLEERKLNGRGSKGYVPRPMFPGYVFIRKLLAKSPPLTRVPGVKFVFRNGLRQVAIDLIRADEVDGVTVLKPKKKVTHDDVLKAERLTSFEALRERIQDADERNRVAALSAYLKTESIMVASVISHDHVVQP